MLYLNRFPIYNKAIFILALILPLSFAQANNCKMGDLTLEYMVVNTLVAEPFYTAHLSGVIDVPNPNYDYTLNIEKNGQHTHAKLKLFVKDNTETMQVITPLEIDDIIKIPHESQRFMIDIEKPYNWGAEYFQAHYTEGLENTKSICMKADYYK